MFPQTIVDSQSLVFINIYISHSKIGIQHVYIYQIQCLDIDSVIVSTFTAQWYMFLYIDADSSCFVFTSTYISLLCFVYVWVARYPVLHYQTCSMLFLVYPENQNRTWTDFSLRLEILHSNVYFFFYTFCSKMLQNKVAN